MERKYIEIKGLNKSFKRGKESVQALDDISFSVDKGQIICVLGPSGCGKSTLIKIICGLEMDFEGDVLINGEPISGPDKTRGIVFQEHRLFPWLTVEQNVGFALNGVDKKEKAQLVQTHIDLVGLSGFEKAYPRQLSGGMAQRGGIARALVNDPELLLLDEPFGALDTFTKMSMQNELKQIQRKSNTTMIMVTHDIDEAVYLADKIIVMSPRPGKIVKVIDVDLAEPRDRNSYEFIDIRKEVFNEF